MQNPGNVQMWIKLGNNCFHNNMHQKALDAYSKALEIEPDNAQVLTDMGVMY